MKSGIALLVVLVASVEGFEPKCQSLFDVILSPDCRTLYRCIVGKPVLMPKCLAGQVFSKSYKVCVEEGSSYDDCKATVVDTSNVDPCEDKPCKNGGICTKQEDDKGYLCTCPHSHTGTNCETVINKSLSVEELCAADPFLVIPHPKECQLYYNCSHKYQSVPRFFEQHLQECPYPTMFSTQSYNCEWFEDVQCGNRTEHKSGCDYLTYRCPVAHCYPCELQFPSCIGLPDGVYPHATKTNSPYFMVCQSERVTQTGRCPLDKSTGRPMFIENGKCTVQ